MKKWIISVVFAILLCCPVVAGAGDDLFDSGKSTMFNYPLMKIPIGDKPSSDSAIMDKNKKHEEAKNDPEKEKETRDKKVDDAIKKAWDEK